MTVLRCDHRLEFAVALGEARRLDHDRSIPEWVWHRIGATTIFPPPALTGATLLETARWMLREYHGKEPSTGQ